MSGSIIKKISIYHLWEKYNLCWNSLHPDVNILVGINGSGKSTVLHILSSVLTSNWGVLEKYGKGLEVTIE